MNENAMNKENKTSALEILYENNPKDTENATSRLRLHTHSQIYVYANFGFATSMIKLATKILAEMNCNFT